VKVAEAVADMGSPRDDDELPEVSPQARRRANGRASGARTSR
jgi:hypothetical protein